MRLETLSDADLDLEADRRINRAEQALAALKSAFGEFLQKASLPSDDPTRRSALFREMTEAENALEHVWDEYARRRAGH